MYEPVGIQRLSVGQIQKLLKGHNVRVKYDDRGDDAGHVIHANAKQIKAIMKKYSGGGGSHTMAFDPYQQKEHMGEGIFGKAFKFLAPHAVRLLRPLIKRGVRAVAGRKASERVDKGIKNLSPLAIMAGEHLINSYEDSPGDEPKVDGGALYPAGYEGGALFPAGGALHPAGYGISPMARHSMEMKAIRKAQKMGMSPDEINYMLQGDGIFDFLDPRKNGVSKAFSNAFDPSKNGVKKGVIKYGKKLASALIHKGIPAVAGLVGTQFGSPMLGTMAGKLAADQIGKATGYGIGRRKGRLVKGSQEAKDYMKALRDRKKK